MQIVFFRSKRWVLNAVFSLIFASVSFAATVTSRITPTDIKKGDTIGYEITIGYSLPTKLVSIPPKTLFDALSPDITLQDFKFNKVKDNNNYTVTLYYELNPVRVGDYTIPDHTVIFSQNKVLNKKSLAGQQFQVTEGLLQDDIVDVPMDDDLMDLLSDNDDEDEEMMGFTDKPDSQFKDYWDSHFIGQVSTLFQKGSTRQKSAYLLRLRYEEKVSFLSAVIEGDAYHTNLDNTYTLSNGGSNDDIKVKKKTEDVLMREAYIKTNVGDKAVLSVGSQIIVWGQSDVFSPIDFFLPYQLDDRGFSINKADNRKPQKMIKLDAYPIKNMVLTGYYMPKFTPSDFINQDLNRLEDGMRLTIPKKSQKAVRLLYQPEWFTIGFTYLDGVSPWGLYKKGSVIQEYDDRYNANLDLWTMADMKMKAIEISKPIGNTAIKLEAAQFKDLYNPDGFEYTQSILEWLYRNNNKKSYIPRKITLLGTAIDGHYDWGILNFYVAYPLITYDSKYDSLLKLENKDEEEIPLFGLHVGKYLGQDKKMILGGYAGMVSLSFGAAIYYTYEFLESWRIGIGIDYVMNFSDETSRPENKDDNNEYELSIVPAVNVAISRRF